MKKIYFEPVTEVQSVNLVTTVLEGSKIIEGDGGDIKDTKVGPINDDDFDF